MVTPVLPQARDEQRAVTRAAQLPSQRQPDISTRNITRNMQATQQRQQQAQQRGGDLELSRKVMRALDERVPKKVREKLFKEVVRELGIDPKSEQAKDISGILTSLEETELEGVRKQFLERVKQAGPGQVREFVGSVLKGETSVGQVFGGETNAGTASPESMTRRIPRPKDVGDLPPREQQASPVLVKALGLDHKQAWRSSDLMKQGFAVPLDRAEQRKLGEEVSTRGSAVTGFVTDAARIMEIFRGRPEVLGFMGGANRFVDQVAEQVQGFFRQVTPGIEINVDRNSPRITRATNQAAQNIRDIFGVEESAVSSAQLESATLALAFRMLQTRGIEGNRITTSMLERNLSELGQSQSEDQFRAALSDSIRRTYGEYSREMSNRLGKKGFSPDLSNLSRDDMVFLRNNPEAVPQKMVPKLVEEIKVRNSEIEAGSGDEADLREAQQPDPSGPTLEEEDQFLRERQTEQQALERERAERKMEMREEAAARAERAEQRVIEGVKRDINAENAAGLKGAFTEIAKAFDSNARTSLRSVGGGSNAAAIAGRRQDPGAFQIDPAPRRTPPRPGGQ